MSIRFLADADLNFAIVKGTRLAEKRIDFLSAVEAGLEGIDDSDVLRLAVNQKRILVSHDLSTIPAHFARALRDGKECPGVFLVPQDVAIGSVIDAIILIWTASFEFEWLGTITYLPSMARHVFPK